MVRITRTPLYIGRKIETLKSKLGDLLVDSKFLYWFRENIPPQFFRMEHTANILVELRP